MSSMSRSTMPWIAGRIARTRLTVNGAVTMRRNRACSGSSMRMKLTEEPSPSSGACFGYPGLVMSALIRGSASSARWSAYRVTSHGVLPSHSRTLTSGPSRCSSCRTGGGSNGHLGSRAMGYSGISVLSSVEFSTVPVIESSRRVRASCGGKRCRPEGLCDLPTAESGLFGHVPADDSGDPARTFEPHHEATARRIALDDGGVVVGGGAAVHLHLGVELIGPEVGHRGVRPVGAEDVGGHHLGLFGGVGAVFQTQRRAQGGVVPPSHVTDGVDPGGGPAVCVADDTVVQREIAVAQPRRRRFRADRHDDDVRGQQLAAVEPDSGDPTVLADQLLDQMSQYQA